MNTNPAIKGLNNLIGGWWALLGFLLFIAAGFWFLGLFFPELYQTWFSGIPLPKQDLADILLIMSAWFIGAFFMGWGAAMLNRKEWGAWAGGVVRLVWLIYLIAAVFLFYYRGPDHWLDEAKVSFHNRYYPLLWAFFGIWILWLTGSAVFLFGKSRRDYYAQVYQTLAPPVPVCAACGLKLQDKQCPECDQAQQGVVLKIGETRAERLLFTNDKTVFYVGRHTDKSQADITISKADTEHSQRISARHLSLECHFEQHHTFTVQDLASKNKTYLNDDSQPLAPHKRYPLKSGDKLMLANEVEINFEVEA